MKRRSQAAGKSLARDGVGEEDFVEVSPNHDETSAKCCHCGNLAMHICVPQFVFLIRRGLGQSKIHELARSTVWTKQSVADLRISGLRCTSCRLFSALIHLGVETNSGR